MNPVANRVAQSPYNYADWLYDRGIIRMSSKVVEGCIGNTGFGASLEVAKYLGRGASCYMIEADFLQMEIHQHEFLRRYKPKPKIGRPELSWLNGRIEDQEEIIKGCDALLFHNYVPIDRKTQRGDNKNCYQSVQQLFCRLVKSKPKHIALWLPYLKDSDAEFTENVFRSLNLEFEKSDNIDYAGELGIQKRNDWKGKIILA